MLDHRLLALLPLLALAGCVVPTTGLTTAYPESTARPFPVRTLLPSGAPRATGVGGSLNVNGTGRTALVEGWATSSSAVLVLVSDPLVRVVSQDREQRPDAAAVMGSPSDSDLGFRLRVRSRHGLVQRLCVLSLSPGGEVRVLDGSDRTWCP